MNIEIRSVATIEEYHACETLQCQAWAMLDNQLEVVPLHLLLSVHKSGGLLLGAFHEDQLAGFVFGFLGRTPDGTIKHCSHMMGVDPNVQGSGIGYQLKLAQRQAVLSQDLDLITWTYDPLEGRNANLNIHKLGAVSSTYVTDLYGPLEDGLNAGLPTDRFQVDWWIASSRVQTWLADRQQPETAPQAVWAHQPGHTAQGLRTPGSSVLPVDAPRVCVEIPREYQAIKTADPGLALEWRLVSREIFRSLFARGYRVVDFRRELVENEQRSLYVLERQENGTS